MPVDLLPFPDPASRTPLSSRSSTNAFSRSTESMAASNFLVTISSPNGSTATDFITVGTRAQSVSPNIDEDLRWCVVPAKTVPQAVHVFGSDRMTASVQKLDNVLALQSRVG